METPGIDKIDRRILEILQRDGTVPVATIAELVHLSTTPCWRRIRRLEEIGVIMRRVVLLDAAKLNLSVTAVVEIKAAKHSADWLARFHEAVSSIPEVVEVHRMSGNIDYMLKVLVPNIAAYDQVYQRLISSVDMSDVSSSFSMEVLKHTTEMPLDYAN